MGCSMKYFLRNMKRGFIYAGMFGGIAACLFSNIMTLITKNQVWMLAAFLFIAISVVSGCIYIISQKWERW